MAEISARAVLNTHLHTGANLLECKKALEECETSVPAAVEAILRAHSDGGPVRYPVIDVYVTPERTIAGLVEISFDKDPAACWNAAETLVHGLAIHVAAMAPAQIVRADSSGDDQTSATLLEQIFVLDDSGTKTVGAVLAEFHAEHGVQPIVQRCCRAKIADAWSITTGMETYVVRAPDIRPQGR